MKSRTLAAGIAGLSVFSAGAPFVMAAPVQHASSHLATHTTTVTLSGKQLMKVNCTVANDPNSGRPTSWLPAMSMESILRQLGIDAHFVPGVNQLVLNMPLGYTVPSNLQVPYHAPKSGQFVIFVNSKSIAYPPTLASSSMPDVPVYYVMEALRALGVSSRWTGSTWAFANKVSVQPAASMPGNVNQTFSLTLSNEPSGSAAGLPTPPVPPNPAVTVQLPMNALLTRTSQSLSGASETTPMEDYVQTGRATYTVNKPIAQVEAWFKAAYTAQGFTVSGSGSSGNFKTGAYVESQSFIPTKQQSGQKEQVTMSYETLGANQTKVEYWVYDIVVPERPSSSQMATGATSMDVKITTTQTQNGNGGAVGTSDTGSPTTATYTVNNAQAINAVIAAINGLTTIDPPGVSSGGPMVSNTSTAKLSFNYPDGRTITVTAVKRGLAYGDVIVDGIPLKDSKGTVWSAMQQAIQQSAQK
ncbi:hypothetical protein [Alicyclobacillus mengziensis]|uniref:Copper amine oxidase-like N-terminal domain-containing protein n=1 Tax=Alicyclobacillus mengziensis TaxID=2931921 RepID=A0A9X7W1M1_9BACL|nr:hypothetical protein [Alicyclobacillus mengziensis]QSO48570.1 hypothetical protein JZ786_06190 [Alicyclobacillus mengziensis]